MKNASGKPIVLTLIVAIAGAVLLSNAPSARAVPHSSLVGEVTNNVGQPLSKDTLMQFADSAGHTKDLMLKTAGVYKFDTTTLTPPIWIKAGNLYAVSL